MGNRQDQNFPSDEYRLLFVLEMTKLCTDLALSNIEQPGERFFSLLIPFLILLFILGEKSQFDATMSLIAPNNFKYAQEKPGYQFQRILAMSG